MKISELAAVIEGILFVAGESVEYDVLCAKLEVKPADVKKAVDFLKEKHGAESGINIIEFKNKIQLSSNSKFAEKIEAVLSPVKEKLLSRATLETLSIIAYKQPITRLEIEEIRGVSSDYAIDILSQNRLIEVVGRKDAIGKPLLYGTTDEFLKRFEIENLNALPKYEDVLARIQTIKANNTESEAVTSKTLYNEFSISDENDETNVAN